MKKKSLGHSEHSREAQLNFAQTWNVFGPVNKNIPSVNVKDLAKCPVFLTIGKTKIKALKLKTINGKLDLTHYHGSPQEGRTSYIYIPVFAPRTGEYKIGIGADWWFEAYLDGNLIGSTMSSGNGNWPPTVDDHIFNVNITEGEHTLAIKFLSGSGGNTIIVGTPSGKFMEGEISAALHAGIMNKITRPIKVVFLGAGSAFLQTLFVDILNIPSVEEGEIALVDIDEYRLELAEKLCRKVSAQMNKNWQITATTDRTKVLKNADYIINCIEVSGTDCVAYDNDIPLKYGVDQCIGDTTGPGGLFKALRTVPVFIDVLKDIEKYCPHAWVLNYTNPMSIMCLAASRTSKTRVIGLCHSVQGASHILAAWANIPYYEMKWTCAGINHLAWFTELSSHGKDLYPKIKKRVLTEPDFNNGHDKVRIDLMMNFGYYCTESSGHDSEYLPYYRKSKSIMKRYCGSGYEGESRFYASNWPIWRKNCDQHRKDIIAGKEKLNTTRSWEYASYIIQAMETNDSFVIYGNVPNRGLIANLPQDGVVEVACLVDKFGIRPTHYGKLPSQCAALCDWNMRFFDLAAEACIKKSIETAALALMLDPLTAAVSCPSDIRKMTYELFKAEKAFLPGFK